MCGFLYKDFPSILSLHIDISVLISERRELIKAIFQFLIVGNIGINVLK